LKFRNSKAITALTPPQRLNNFVNRVSLYGWSHPDGDDNKTERFVTVLEIPPVDSPQTAVKMAIYSDIKKGNNIPVTTWPLGVICQRIT
jgi:hypothetical protein